jgi:hypothetical protein
MKGTARNKDKAMSWCIKNRILIYPVPITNSKLVIEIDYKGKLIPGTKEWSSKGGKTNKDRWWIRIKELYKEYYDKHTHKPQPKEESH